MAGGSQPYKQKMSANCKMSTSDKFCSKSSGADKYSKSTTQNKYLTKTDAGEKYSSVKKTASDKYSCGPAGEKYSVTKKSSEDKYSKSNGKDTHLKAKTSSKDTYVKGAEKKQDCKPFGSQQQQQQQNQKTFSSKTADSKKDKMFCEKEVHTGAWTSRPYNKEIKNANKDDRNRGLNALGTGAVAGVGVLAAAGPRKRDNEREKDRRNNGHHNGVNNRDEKGRERDESRAQHNNAIPTEGAGASDGCCVLL